MPKLSKRQMDEIEQDLDLVVHKWLEWLGDTAEQVVKTLEQLKLNGKCDDERRCPIANFLLGVGFDNVRIMSYAEKDGGGNFVKVDVHFYHRKRLFPKGKDHWTMEYTLYKVPQAINDFINAFDAGYHPQLIAG